MYKEINFGTRKVRFLDDKKTSSWTIKKKIELINIVGQLIQGEMEVKAGRTFHLDAYNIMPD